MKKLLVVFFLCIGVVSSLACTKLAWYTDKFGMFVSRSEDFKPDAKPTIEVRPRGEIYRSKDGVEWTSKYSSAMISVFGFSFVEGINEVGLSASVLSLDEESGVKNSKNKGNLLNLLIVPYLVDNFSSVKEAINALKKLNIQVYQTKTGEKLGGHYMVQDSKGDSVVIEFVDNEMKVYHGIEYNVMTNSPTYEKQIKSWEKFAGNSADYKVNNLPGGYTGNQRFIRAKYHMENLSVPTSLTNGIVQLNSAIPVVPQLKGKSKTQYTISYNLNDKVIYLRYQFKDYFNQFYFNFNNLNDGNFYTLDIKNNSLSGDITEAFIKSKGIMQLYK